MKVVIPKPTNGPEVKEGEDHAQLDAGANEKAEIFADIKEAVENLILVQQGKLTAQPLEELLAELREV